LLEAGSKTDVCESKSRQSPLYLAISLQLVEAVQLLIKAGELLLDDALFRGYRTAVFISAVYQALCQ